MFKLSVVIPVYNCELYIEQCLESIINQTYKNIEIICIDDCSTDNSYKILKEYEVRDSRIKVFKNDINRKAGLTRNIGIEHCTGDYIHFLDADDWLDLNAYEIVLEKLLGTKDEIDILSFQLKHISTNGKVLKVDKHSDADDIERVLQPLDLQGCWETINATKIYRTGFLINNKNLRYKNYNVGEDIHFCYITFLNANKVFITNDAIYNYRTTPNSLGTTRCKNPETIKRIFYDVYALTNTTSKISQNKICSEVFYYSFWSFWESYKTKQINYKELKEIMKELDEKALNENFSECWWYCYCQEILHRPFFYVLLKNTVRKLLSQHFPQINKCVILLRQRIQKKRINNNVK